MWPESGGAPGAFNSTRHAELDSASMNTVVAGLDEAYVHGP
jgi:hypothetical protein